MSASCQCCPIRTTVFLQDPYSAAEGFWYAHIGWMFVKQDPAKIGRVDISDLSEDPAVRFQHRHYLLFGAFSIHHYPRHQCDMPPQLP